ncbi:hypothetical protein OC845_000326 [Tilletia horrida]|nr:hypothetical protein OC845_000326 [Tilletia horrida]
MEPRRTPSPYAPPPDPQPTSSPDDTHNETPTQTNALTTPLAPRSPALSAPGTFSSSAFRSSTPRRGSGPELSGPADSRSHVGAAEAQEMLDEPEDLLQSEERAVLEMLTSMSAPTPNLPDVFSPASSSPQPHSLPGVLPSHSQGFASSEDPATDLDNSLSQGHEGGDEAEETSLLAPTALGGSTAVSYHSSDSSSLGQQSEDSADPAFGRNLRALYRQHDPESSVSQADAARMDELGLPSDQRTVHLESQQARGWTGQESYEAESDEMGLPADYGYRQGFQTQPRMTFDVHTIEEVAEPSSSGTSATSRTELSAPPPRPPARIGASPFGSASVGSPLGSRFRGILQQQRDREQGSSSPGHLNVARSTSPLRSPRSAAQTFVTAQRSISPLRSSVSTSFETPAQTPNPMGATSPPGTPTASSVSGSAPSSPSKVRQLSRFFESSVSGGSESDVPASGSTSGLARRTIAATGVVGGAMAAAATRERERLRDLERSLAGSPTRRQPSGMTGSVSTPTMSTRPDTLGARSPIFTASRSMGAFGPQSQATTPPTTLQHPVARRGVPARPSVRSIARQFANMIDDGSSSPRSGAGSPRKHFDEQERKDETAVEAMLSDEPSRSDDVPLVQQATTLNRNKFGTIRSISRISEDDEEGSQAGGPPRSVDPTQRPSIRSGTLWYFDAHRPEPLWIEVTATLLVDSLELRWGSDAAGAPEQATGLRLDLNECEDAHSVFSPDHGSSFLDVGAQTARAQGLLRINPFQLQFPDGIERLATRTPMERLHWIDAIRDVLRQNIQPSRPEIITTGASVTDQSDTNRPPVQTDTVPTSTRGSFVTAEAADSGPSPTGLTVRSPLIPGGNVTRLVSAFSETSSDRTPQNALLGKTADPTSGPPIPPKRDGEPPANVSPGDPQYGEVAVSAPRQVREPFGYSARSVGPSLNDQFVPMPGSEQGAGLRTGRVQAAANFFDPNSTASDQSRMLSVGDITGSRNDEDLAFSVASDIIDDFGPRTPPAFSQVSLHFGRSGSLLEPSDSASNRVVPSEIGTIRRDPSQPPPFYAVSPDVGDLPYSGEGRGLDSSGRGPYSTPGPSRFLTPAGSFRDAQRASSHLPLSASEHSLAAVPEEGPEGSRSPSVTPTQLSKTRREALAPQDLNRADSTLSAASHHSKASAKSKATATSINSRDVAQLLDFLEEQARARAARDRYLEEQIKGFQQTIAVLQMKRTEAPAPAPSEPSDSSGGQSMHTAPEDPEISDSGGAKPVTSDELNAMKASIDRVLEIVSTTKGAPLEQDVARMLGAASAGSGSTTSETFQTADAGIPSPPHSVSDGETGRFQTARATQTSSAPPPPSTPGSWISGSTLLSNWTGKSERIPARSWVSSATQPGAPPNSEYAPSSVTGASSDSDVTIKPKAPSTVLPSEPTIPSGASTITVDMEAEIRKLRMRKAQQQAPPALYPENQRNGWYTPRAPDGTPLEKDLPNVPGIRWTPGAPPMRAPSTAKSATTASSIPVRREVATYTQEDFPREPSPMHISIPSPDPGLEFPEQDSIIEAPPLVMEDDNVPPPMAEDYPESHRGSTIASNASAEFKEVLKKLQEAEEARQQQQKQQADIARYLNELNAWLERDVMDRTKEWRALSSGVQSLQDDLTNLRNKPATVLSDAPRQDDDAGRSRPPRAESPTGPAALRPNTTLSLAPPIVAPQPYSGANWSNPDADRPESDSGQSRRSGRAWSAQDDDDKKDEPKKEGLLSRVASRTGKVLLGTAAVGAAGLVGNEIRKHIEKREDKKDREEKDRENQARKDELDKEKREEKREEQIRKDEQKNQKELMAAMAKEDKDKKNEKKADEAVGTLAVSELAKIAADKAGGGTTVITPAGTVVAGGKGATLADAGVPTNPKGVFQTNLPRAERLQPAVVDADAAPTPLKDTIKSALKMQPAPSTASNVAEAAVASKEAAKASKEAANAAKEVASGGGGTQKKKGATEADAAEPAKGGGGAAASPAVTVKPQPDGSVTVQATPAPAAGGKAAKGGGGGAPPTIVVPAAGKEADSGGGGGGGDSKAKGGDKNDAKSVVKEAAGGAALTVAVEEILKHLLKQQDDARKQQDDAKKAQADLKAAQAEAEKKAKEARDKERSDLVNAVAAKIKEDQAKEAKALDAKTAIEQLVANMNAQKAAEAKRQADADATIKKLADELLKLNAEQSQKAVSAVSAASKDTIQKSVKDYNDELTKVLSKEVKAMFEDVGKIRETKRALELELGDLFAIKARHLKDVAPPRAAAPAEKKKSEDKPKEKDPPKEEKKKEEPPKKPEPIKPPPLTVQLPDRSKFEPLNLNFGPRTAREGGGPPPAAAAAAPPKADKPKEGKEGKSK